MYVQYRRNIVIKYNALAFSLFCLAACEGGGIGLVGSPAWQMSTTAEQKTAYFSKTCNSYGFQPNTPQMTQCIQEEARGARRSGSSLRTSGSSRTVEPSQTQTRRSPSLLDNHYERLQRQELDRTRMCRTMPGTIACY